MRRRLLTLALIGTSLMFLAALPAHAGGGCHVAQPTSAESTSVDLTMACMVPTIVRVTPGATVIWTNRDEIPHNVIGVGFGGDSTMKLGDTLSYRFDEPGIYPYGCSLHPRMYGAVIVGDAETAAVAGGEPAVEVRTKSDEVGRKSSETKIPQPAAATGVGLVSAAAGYGVASLRRKKQLP